jgi:hypothetical protein
MLAQTCVRTRAHARIRSRARPTPMYAMGPRPIRKPARVWLRVLPLHCTPRHIQQHPTPRHTPSHHATAKSIPKQSHMGTRARDTHNTRKHSHGGDLTHALRTPHWRAHSRHSSQQALQRPTCQRGHGLQLPRRVAHVCHVLDARALQARTPRNNTYIVRMSGQVRSGAHAQSGHTQTNVLDNGDISSGAEAHTHTTALAGGHNQATTWSRTSGLHLVTTTPTHSYPTHISLWHIPGNLIPNPTHASTIRPVADNLHGHHITESTPKDHGVSRAGVTRVPTSLVRTHSGRSTHTCPWAPTW